MNEPSHYLRKLVHKLDFIQLSDHSTETRLHSFSDVIRFFFRAQPMTFETTALRSGMAALAAFALLLATLVIGRRFVINYIFGYLLVGILLEMAYLAIHFLLNMLFASKPNVARTASRSLAAVVALPETLIIAVLTILILQSLAVVVDAPSIIFTAVVLVGLVLPTLFLWSYAVGLIGRRV